MSSTHDPVALLGLSLRGEASLSSWNAFVESSDSPILLRGLVLEECNLTGLTFKGCDLDGAVFDRCRMVGVSFDNGVLTDARMRGCNLRNATFVKTDGRRLQILDSDLEGADLSWANFQGAHLENVDLTKVKLWKTDLRSATFDEFSPSQAQHFIGDASRPHPVAHSERSLEDVLRIVGAMIGTPYHWEGKGPARFKVRLPERIKDPRSFMEALLDETRLSATPHQNEAGQLLYFKVSPRRP